MLTAAKTSRVPVMAGVTQTKMQPPEIDGVPDEAVRSGSDERRRRRGGSRSRLTQACQVQDVESPRRNDRESRPRRARAASRIGASPARRGPERARYRLPQHAHDPEQQARSPDVDRPLVGRRHQALDAALGARACEDGVVKREGREERDVDQHRPARAGAAGSTAVPNRPR